MTARGAASIPSWEGGSDQATPPTLEALRVALRPPELPLPTPRSVREAAHRVTDLVHAEQLAEARRLADRFLTMPAPLPDRLALHRARLEAAAIMDDPEQLREAAFDLVGVLREAGCAEQAEATVRVLIERGPARARGSAGAGRGRTGAPGTESSGAERPAGSGRRRGDGVVVSPPLTAVVRGLELTSLAAAAGSEAADPRRAQRVLLAALRALPAVRDQVHGDPEPLLRLRLAQALEGSGRREEATTQALDVLELLEQDLEQSVRQEPSPAPADGEVQRLTTAAHAILARTLSQVEPMLAVQHAMEALAVLPEVDDPPLRVGLITDLLDALMHAGFETHASFVAGRLLSLQRTLRRDGLRTRPLLAVAAQRIRAQRHEAAQVPLDQARQIAREQRDRRASLTAARLAAVMAEQTGDAAGSLAALRQVAADARWIAGDLVTPTQEQGPLIRTELDALALVMRRAMDQRRWSIALAAAEQIERRTLREEERPPLTSELLWDQRVDAVVGRFIIVATRRAEGEQAVTDAEYRTARAAAFQAIDEVPAGHEARARYWATYVDDRHAAFMAERGQVGAALRAARSAREGWRLLERAEDAERMASLTVQLEAAEEAAQAAQAAAGSATAAEDAAGGAASS
jgi:hypothetical protein